MLKLFYKLSLLCLILLSATVLYQKHTYAYHTLVQVDPLPHTKTLMGEDKYADANEYLSYFIQFDYVQQIPEAHVLLDEIKAKRESLSYQSGKIAEGISTGTSDELFGQISAIGSDFFLIGDLRDLAIEGEHYYHDEKVDSVLVSLSTIGLVASVSTLFTFGGSSVAKSAVSSLKMGHKSKLIPPWLNSYLVKEAKVVRKEKSLSSIKPLFKSLDTIHHEVGLNHTLKLLSRTSNMKELQGISSLSKRYGKESTTLLDLSKKKLLIHADTFKRYDKSTVKVASTYGENGFVHLLTRGGKHFIKTTKQMKAYAKVGYKGEIWKVFLWLMKHLNDVILISIMSIATLLLLPIRKLFILIHRSRRSQVYHSRQTQLPAYP